MTDILARHKYPCERIVSLKEQGKLFKLHNSKGFTQVKLDGDVIPAGQGPKCCDYYLFLQGQTEIFVELKGRQVEDGLEQLLSSVGRYRQRFPNGYACLVSSRVPPAASTKRQQAMMKMAKIGIKLYIKASPAEYEYKSDGTIRAK